MKKFATIGLLLAAGLTSGCIAFKGEDRYVRQEPTLGKELQDLKCALDKGAISDAEFAAAKQKLIRGGHGD